MTSRLASRPGPERLPARLSLARLREVEWAWQSPRYLALDFDFSVRVTDPDVASGLAAVFEPFEAGGSGGSGGSGGDGGDGHGRVTFSIVDRGPGGRRRYALYRGSRVVVSGQSPQVPLAHLLWAVNRGVVTTARGCLLLHAGAAEQGGRAVVLPAPPEHGKSTLTAGLVRSGLRYVTDEVVAVDLESLEIRPFPKALSIDVGSWSVLRELEPRASGGLQSHLLSQWQVPPGALRADAISPRCRPALIVAPTYRPGGPTELIRLRRADAVTLLAGNSFNLARLGRPGFDATVELARRCECYVLFLDDLGSACRAIGALLERAVGPVGPPAPSVVAIVAAKTDPPSPAGPAGLEVIDEDFVPTPATGLDVVDLDGCAVLWDGGRAAVHVLNPTGTLVWSRFDGQASVGTIVTELTDRYGVPREVVAGDVLRVVRQVAGLGLLAGSHGQDKPSDMVDSVEIVDSGIV